MDVISRFIQQSTDALYRCCARLVDTMAIKEPVSALMVLRAVDTGIKSVIVQVILYS